MKRKLIRIKNTVIKASIYFAIYTVIISVSALDSEPLRASMIFLLSLGWLTLVSYATELNKKEREEKRQWN